jgi:Trk K+ transport system NAD-binding subunit
MTFLRALYVTYGLIFMEHLTRLPDHWLLDLFCVLLPPLGLVVILDGMARFGYHLLRRDETGGEWMRAMAKTYKNHVILVGLGKVGVRVLEQLIRLGEDVVVLEHNSANENLAYAHKNGVPVLIGSSRQVGILEDLNIADAKSLIAATDDDLANLEVALDARKAHPGIRVVMRMYDQELAGKIRNSFDIHLAFSTSALAAPLFATSSSDRSILNSFYVGEQLLVVARLTICTDSQLVGKKIRDVKTDHKIFFLSHKRGPQETQFPHSDLDFQVGDEVVVQSEPATLKLLHRWNGDKPPY